MKSIFIKTVVEAVASKKATIAYNESLNKLTIGFNRKNEIRTTIVDCTVDEYRQLTFLISFAKETRYHDLHL